MSVSSPTLRHRRDEILSEAAARGSRVTVTHRSPGGWRLYTGQFENPPSDREGLWVLLQVPAEGADGLGDGQDVGLTFRRGHKKCICHTTIAASARTATGVRLQLAAPTQIQELQRRVFERTSPPPGRPIRVQIHGQATAPADVRMRITGQLEDISAGGLRVRARLEGGLDLGATYRCHLESAQMRSPLSLDAVLRHAEAPINGVASLGLQFIGLEASAEGYEKMLELARFVKHLQRCTSRRTKPSRPAASDDV